jgi:hypothetical protein
VHVVEPSEWPPVELARVRRAKRFSVDAHVVSWTSDEAALRPFREAGFKIGTVISPEQALGMLAAEWPRPQTDSATAWLALARHGAALVIVHHGDVLYSRRIHWRYKTPTRPNEQLLQRYTLVAHLAPELQHGMAVVRERYGAEVDGAVTCGNLPDLRSLTMPLIEELNLEVEPLDTLDGLELSPAAMAQRAVDYASALRLASAVTALPPVHPPQRARWWVGAAAALVAIAGVAGWWFATQVSDVPAPARRAVASVPPPSPAPTAGSPGSEPPVVPLIPRSQPAARSAAPAQRPEPLPAVSSILIAPNRRLAILDGNIVGEGDSVGNRLIVRIDRDGVVLREPAGQEVRVGIRRPKQASQP